MKRIVLAMVMSMSLVAGAAFARSDLSEPCTTHTVQGDYGFSFQGRVFSFVLGFGPIAAAGTVSSDGEGNLSGSYTESFGGVIRDKQFVGTYTAQANCTISVSVMGATVPSTWTAEGKGVIVDGGREVLWVGTDAGAVVSGTVKKQ